jgi:hypothetical protein
MEWGLITQSCTNKVMNRCNPGTLVSSHVHIQTSIHGQSHARMHTRTRTRTHARACTNQLSAETYSQTHTSGCSCALCRVKMQCVRVQCCCGNMRACAVRVQCVRVQCVRVQCCCGNMWLNISGCSQRCTSFEIRFVEVNACFLSLDDMCRWNLW